ncbi:MAG: hypothetical protein V4691_06750 [Pseudomonadota bacterium]
MVSLDKAYGASSALQASNNVSKNWGDTDFAKKMQKVRNAYAKSQVKKDVDAILRQESEIRSIIDSVESRATGKNRSSAPNAADVTFLNNTLKKMRTLERRFDSEMARYMIKNAGVIPDEQFRRLREDVDVALAIADQFRLTERMPLNPPSDYL